MVELNKISCMEQILLVIFLSLFFQAGTNASSENLTLLCRENPVLFQSRNYKGQYLKLTKSIGMLSVYGFGGKASSLCVPDGWELIIYKDDGYCSTDFHIRGAGKIF